MWSEFVKDRDETLIRAVVADDWDGVKAFCKRWGTEIPEDETVMKAGTYKAAGACLSLPEEIKKLAARKCVELGFSPAIGGYYK